LAEIKQHEDEIKKQLKKEKEKNSTFGKIKGFFGGH
jgi:hypothetical protein